MNDNVFEYPIICFARDGSMIPSRGRITETRHVMWGLSLAYFEGLLIVDSNGISYKVERALPDRPISKIGQLLEYWFGPKNVHLQIANHAPISLSDFKSVILKYIDGQREIWESSGDVGALKLRIEGAESIRKTIDALVFPFSP